MQEAGLEALPVPVEYVYGLRLFKLFLRAAN